jgi:D-alanine-D-alanine ligase
MKIGMTYDLKADYLAEGWSEEEACEFDSPVTIDAIAAVLGRMGHEVVRVGRCVELVRRLAAGDRYDLVFNLAEGAHGRSREAQVPAVLEAFGIPYTFCDPLTAALSLDKALTKRVVRDLGLPTPAFLLVEAEDDIGRVDLPFPLFAKPNAEGSAKGISRKSIVRTRDELAAACTRILREHGQPALVEEFLPGREFTVGIIGTGPEAEPVGVMEVVLLPRADQGLYSYDNKELWQDRVTYRLAGGEPVGAEAAEVALAAYRGIGCRDAGRVDLRCDGRGRVHFIEVNPLAGLNPERSDLPILCGMAGMDFATLIGRIVQSAARRITAAP